MKKVIVKREDGWLEAYWVKDDATDTEFGIPDMPPDLNRLDWDWIRREIHNQLIEQNLSTYQDVQRKGNAVSSIVLSVVKSSIVNLYKLVDMEVKNVNKLDNSS